MAHKPKAFEMCETPHECQRCHKTTLCGTYRWACPWLNGDKDQLCDDCWYMTAEEFEAWTKKQEGMES